MDTYNLIKKQILEINQEILNIMETASALPGVTEHSFDVWRRTCDTIAKQVNDEIMRVAAVGAIKSGKSTFVNALFKGDHLKRGAGVVTSIVTRVRQGRQLKAALYLKSLDEINSDIDRAMVLFPATVNSNQNLKVDIQDESHRRKLSTALSELQTEQLISQDTRSAASVLLSCYLKGYDRVQEILTKESRVLSFSQENFESHREFTGDDCLSVYLNDIQLEIPSEELGQNLEIADCQGSDSPNPLHLAMIQDYLVLANLIIYVISSRTGIRQADIRFLSIIKKMGLLPNTFFVINCDLSEHDSMEDLNQVLQKITEDVALIIPSPEIYSFSSLYNLFKSQGDNLTEKDWDRVGQWEKEIDLIDFHQKETQRFNRALKKKITDERAALLSRNHLTRLSLISRGLAQWIGFNKTMLERDSNGVKKLTHQMDHHKARIEKAKKLIRNTLNGAITQMKKDLRREIDRFFDTRSGSVLGGVIDYVRSYPIGENAYAQNLTAKSFAGALFLVYQDFKQAVDLFMAESVNPEIVQLVLRLEEEMVTSLKSISEPFETMVQDAVREYCEIMSEAQMELSESIPPSAIELDLRAVKQTIDLKLPTVQAAMHYSARIKTEAVARLGYYTIVRLMKKIFRKNIDHEREGELKALKVGVRRMKREMEKSMEATFRDYRENIKFQYFLKLADALAEDLYDRLIDQFQAYISDVSVLMDDFTDKKTDKSEISACLNQMEHAALAVDQKIGQIKMQALMLSG